MGWLHRRKGGFSGETGGWGQHAGRRLVRERMKLGRVRPAGSRVVSSCIYAVLCQSGEAASGLNLCLAQTMGEVGTICVAVTEERGGAQDSRVVSSGKRGVNE